MKTRFFPLLVAALLAAPPGGKASGGGDTQSGPPGAYFSGVYRDLFAELLGEPRPAVSARIDSAFRQLFYGDDLSQRIYYPVGGDMAYIEDIANNDVRTEGMSYGMMICVQLDKRTEFDRLWKWAMKYMRFDSGPHRGYFAWHTTTGGFVIDSTAASDGEEWFAMSLFFASARWGDGTAGDGYRTGAEDILRTMLHKESEPGRGRVTNMFRSKEHLVAFVPDEGASWFTDPSYQLPHFYELWGRWAASDNRFWCDAASASRKLLRNAADTVTGLSPDYANFDGTPMKSWPGGHDEFRFDAWRVAMNIAVDHAWFCSDPWETVEADRLLDFFGSREGGTYGNQYTLEGKELSADHSAGLVAMNAAAALASTRAKRRDFVREFWNTPVPRGKYRYYDGMLYMLAMLQVSGNFRVYDPTGTPVRECPR